MSTKPDNMTRTPSVVHDDGTFYNELVSILVSSAKMAQHGIPSYAYGDNEAACEMASILSRMYDVIGHAIALIESRAEALMANTNGEPRSPKN